jgi:hypothetical protein
MTRSSGLGAATEHTGIGPPALALQAAKSEAVKRVRKAADANVQADLLTMSPSHIY